jgi:hypothetical protein
VLPISTDAPEDLSLLLDEEVSQIAELLKPNHRAREQARARIRSLLAMQLHQEPDTRVSDEVARAETGIRQGKNRAEVFPKQESLGAEVSGTGINVTVHFSEKGEGAAVRYVSDDSEEAAAIGGQSATASSAACSSLRGTRRRPRRSAWTALRASRRRRPRPALRAGRRGAS